MNYSSLAYVYDKLTFNVEYKKRAEYIHALLTENGCDGGILLDLACGTGTLSKYLADFGYDIILVDNSDEMLNVAREKLPEALILCQDMRELDLYGTVNSAVCSLDGVNHLLKPIDVKNMFSRVSLFIEKGGIFVFDVNTPYKHEKVLGSNTFVYEKDNIYCVWQNSYKRKSRAVDIEIDIFTEENGTYIRQRENFSERAYSIEDIKSWLADANFRVLGIFDDLTREPLREDSQRAYFVAEKL